MNCFEKVDELVDSYFEEGNSVLELMINEEIKSDFQDFNSFFLAYLESSILEENAERLEAAIIIAPRDKKCISLFQRALLENWHGWQEDIVGILEDFSDKNSVEILYKALEIRFSQQNYNNHYSLHKKIMWAIYKIEGKSCKEKLKKAEKYISPELRNEFRQFLGQMK